MVKMVVFYRLLNVLALAAILLALLAADTAFACVSGSSSPMCKGGPIDPAPGPIAGAGLPVLAIGYGAYWLFKRRGNAD